MLSDPAMEVFFTDMWLAVVCHCHPQKPPFLYELGWLHCGLQVELDDGIVPLVSLEQLFS